MTYSNFLGRLHRRWPASVAVLAAFSALGAWSVMAAHGTTAATALPSVPVPVVFRSDDGQTGLAVQLDSGGLELPGSFDFQVVGRGIYSGRITPRPTGPQIVHLQGDASTVNFTPADGGAALPASVRMEGEINTAHHTASINVWTDGVHYHLGAVAPNVADAQNVAQQVLTATIAQNWHTVYLLLAPEITANLTEADFTGRRAGGSAPRVLSGNLVGQGQVTVDASGVAHFGQPVSLLVQMPGGDTRSTTSTLYLTLEDGVWHFLTTTTLS
jgi:hypothetical protein